MKQEAKLIFNAGIVKAMLLKLNILLILEGFIYNNIFSIYKQHTIEIVRMQIAASNYYAHENVDL